jgi:hypothetical protein
MERSLSELTNDEENNEDRNDDETSEMSAFEKDLEEVKRAHEDDDHLEVDDDITVLLDEIEDMDMGKKLSLNIRSLLKKALVKYSAVVEKKHKPASRSKTTKNPAISLKAIVDQTAINNAVKNGATNIPQSQNPEDEAENYMSMMVQKKLVEMQKQIELAEQKSRSATLQW